MMIMSEIVSDCIDDKWVDQYINGIMGKSVIQYFFMGNVPILGLKQSCMNPRTHQTSTTMKKPWERWVG